MLSTKHKLLHLLIMIKTTMYLNLVILAYIKNKMEILGEGRQQLLLQILVSLKEIKITKKI